MGDNAVPHLVALMEALESSQLQDRPTCPTTAPYDTKTDGAATRMYYPTHQAGIIAALNRSPSR